MLKELILKNLVLIDEASVTFESGLNIISGETGAGKTALIEAISWVLGERIDSSKVRDPSQKALVQAAFDIHHKPHLLHQLEEAGIHPEHGEPLIIQREVSPNGKSRALINGQLVSAQLLAQLAPELISLISQHSHQLLREQGSHRYFLDLYGDLIADVKAFQEAKEEEKTFREELQSLQDKEKTQAEKLTVLQMQADELATVNLKEGEEEELMQAYEREVRAEELILKCGTILQILDESQLHRVPPLIEQLTPFSKDLQELLPTVKEAHLILRETGRALTHFQDGLECDPKRLAFLDERLKKIDSLKKKYRKTSAELVLWQASLRDELICLGTLEKEIETAQIKLEKAVEKTKNLTAQLFEKRQKTGQKLGAELAKALRALNIPHAEVEIRVSKEGDVDFYFKSNQGEKFVPVRESTSGGELARLFLSLTVLLAEKNQPSSMIFDEIDANVGGKTATLIGEQLKALGKHRQVICITHFPQVAKQADHHIRIYKKEKAGRTVAIVQSLDEKERMEELVRMNG